MELNVNDLIQVIGQQTVKIAVLETQLNAASQALAESQAKQAEADQPGGKEK